MRGARYIKFVIYRIASANDRRMDMDQWYSVVLKGANFLSVPSSYNFPWQHPSSCLMTGYRSVAEKDIRLYLD